MLSKEFIIAFSIGAILTAITIPSCSLIINQRRSNEATIIMEQIAQAEEAYHRTNGSYIKVGPYPFKVPGSTAVTWNLSHTQHFIRLPFGPPDKPLYFQYAVGVTDDNQGYTVEAIADIDDDGVMQRWTIIVPSDKNGDIAIALSSECTKVDPSFHFKPVPCDIRKADAMPASATAADSSASHNYGMRIF